MLVASCGHAQNISAANSVVNSAAHGFRQTVSISVPDMNDRKAKPTDADRAAAAILRAAWEARGRKPSQSAIGRDLDISQGAVSQYLAGSIPMNYMTLLAFCRILGVEDPRSVRSDLPEQGLLNGGGSEQRQSAPPSQPARLDPDMVAETIRALRLYYRRRGQEYDPERQPGDFVWAYGLRLSLGEDPSSADLIDFGAKLAERVAKKAEAARGNQREGSQQAVGGD